MRIEKIGFTKRACYVFLTIKRLQTRKFQNVQSLLIMNWHISWNRRKFWNMMIPWGYQFLQDRFLNRDYQTLTVREKLRYRHIDALNQLLKLNEVKARTLKKPYEFDGEKALSLSSFSERFRNHRKEIRIYSQERNQII